MDTQKTLATWNTLVREFGGDSWLQMAKVISNRLFRPALYQARETLTLALKQNLVTVDEVNGAIIVDDYKLAFVLESMREAIEALPEPDDWEEYCQLMAYIFEAARLPLHWPDLTARQCALIERVDRKAGSPDFFFRPIDFIFRFMFWWGRTGGQLPGWYPHPPAKHVLH